MRGIAVFLMACFGFSAQAAEILVHVTYLRVETPAPPTLSNLDPPPEDLGIAGALLGREDNATTGRFLGQTHQLDVMSLPAEEDVLAAAAAALNESPFLVLDAPADILTAVADLPEAENALLFNATSEDNALRNGSCRANLLHSAASRAMRADALIQFFVKKRWTDLVMIRGARPEDIAFAEALRNAASKFGLVIRDEAVWEFDADMRRNAAQEVPVFTQEFGEYDALVVADETHDFGRYVLYNTWYPRPVAGSEGLAPQAWSPVVEQWGAAQLQSRFTDLAGRDMESEDYASWAAIRTIGEAVTRTGSADPATLRDYILGPEFELAGFKGRPMSYRTWNGQLRQPVALVHPRALVAQAPLEGFLHRVSELVTRWASTNLSPTAVPLDNDVPSLASGSGNGGRVFISFACTSPIGHRSQNIQQRACNLSCREWSGPYGFSQGIPA